MKLSDRQLAHLRLARAGAEQVEAASVCGRPLKAEPGRGAYCPVCDYHATGGAGGRLPYVSWRADRTAGAPCPNVLS